MAGIKITDLPAAPSAQLTDVFPVDQLPGPVTYKESNSQLLSLFEANIVITPSNFSGTLPVANGGTGNTTFTPYSIITAGTTATGPFQNVVGVGTAGQQLTSNGAGALPSWQASGGNPLTTKGDLFTFTTVDARLPVGTINGQFLQVNSGTATGLAWSTATIPSTATNVARILRSDGTNWVQTTATFADSYGASEFLYSNGANNVAGLATAINGLPVTGNTGIPVMLAGPAATGRVLTSNAAAAPSWSTSTFPSVGGTAGNVLISDGTNYIASTSLWPNTVGASGKVVISNGTTNVYSTPTYPNASVTTGKFIISDGTNYIASTSIMPNTVGAAGKIIRSDGTVNAYSTATYPDTAGTTGNVLTSDGTNWISSAGAATAAFNQVNTQTITATGAFTYTPTTGTKYAIFELQGAGAGSAGGGGGGGSGSAPFGGGGGAYQKILVSGTANLAAISGSVGAGGAGGASGNNAGSNGGDTTLVINSGSTWTSGGGVAGAGRPANASADVSTGAAGGANTSGTNGTLVVAIPGGRSGWGFISAAAAAPYIASYGGASALSNSLGAATDQPVAGNLYGGGAAGGLAIGANVAGAAGANGVVIITEFISV